MNNINKTNKINELVKQNFLLNKQYESARIQRNREIIKNLEKLPNKQQDILNNLTGLLSKIKDADFNNEEVLQNINKDLLKGNNVFQLYGSESSSLNKFINMISEYNHLISRFINAGDIFNLIIGKNNLDINVLTKSLIESQIDNPIIIIKEADKLNLEQLNHILNFLSNVECFDEFLGYNINLKNKIFLIPLNNKEKIVNSQKIYFFEDLNYSAKLKIIKNDILSSINKQLNAYYDMTFKDISKFMSVLFNNNLDNVEKALENYLGFLNNKKIKKYTSEYFEIWDQKNNFKENKQDFYKTYQPGEVNIIGVNKYFDKANISKIIVKNGSGNEDKILMKNDKDMFLSVSIAKELALQYNDEDINKNSFIVSATNISSELAGNSAGISLSVAFLSLLKNMPISSDIAFTGAVALNGDIKGVGGADLKLIECSNNQIKKVFIPYENEKDYLSVKEYLRNDMEVILTKNFNEVANEIFDEKINCNATI